MSAHKAPQMERILWKDGFCTDGRFIRDPPPPVTIDSIGFVIKEADDHVVLARDRDGEYCRCTVSIPKDCIISRGTLLWS